MKILGIVTLYNPPKEVGENLSSYAPFLDGLYLWDNTAGGSNVDSLLPPEVAKRVLMHRRGRNVGIAMALNSAIDLAQRRLYPSAHDGPGQPFQGRHVSGLLARR